MGPMRTLCLGEALVDLVCEHAVDSPAQADAFVPRFGGDVANAAVTAARLGADIALAGGAGEDAWGAWLRDRLAAEGVALDWFGLLSGVRTPIAFVTVDRRGEPTFVFYGDVIAPAVRAVGAASARGRHRLRRAVPDLEHAAGRAGADARPDRAPAGARRGQARRA